MKLVDNSCYIWFQQAFNGKVVIARYLMQYLQIFSSFLVLLLFHSPEGSWNKLQNMRNSENIFRIKLGTVQ